MKRRHQITHEPVATGFQIAPMVDVVFVIMLFFMVIAGSLQVEGRLGMQLPCPSLGNANVKFPDSEVTLGISEDGTVTLNDEVFDTPDDKALPMLTRTLRRLATATARQGDKLLATLQADEMASYDRIIDVMNALQKAEVRNVTFAVGGRPF